VRAMLLFIRFSSCNFMVSVVSFGVVSFTAGAVFWAMPILITNNNSSVRVWAIILIGSFVRFIVSKYNKTQA